MTDKAWEGRTKTRQLGMEAVPKARVILGSDDAHDTFTRTLDLAQKEGVSHRMMRSQVAERLAAVANKVQSTRLVAFASRIWLVAVTRARKAIHDMVALLLREDV